MRNTTKDRNYKEIVNYFLLLYLPVVAFGMEQKLHAQVHGLVLLSAEGLAQRGILYPKTGFSSILVAVWTITAIVLEERYRL